MIQFRATIGGTITMTIIKILLAALVFAFVIPHISGAYFHGGYIKGLGMAIILSCIHIGFLAVVQPLIRLLALWGLATGEVTLLIILVIVGCIIVPPLELQMLAKLFPSSLGFHGWWPAIEGAGLFIVIHLFTRSRTGK